MFKDYGGRLMDDQNVYVGLEIADHELRFVVGQFLNTRLNVLKVERVPITGLQHVAITHQQAIVERIKQATQHIHDTLGIEPKRVILSLPSLNMHRYIERMRIPTKGLVTLDEIQTIYANSFKVKIPEHETLVNVGMTRFIVNGIVMRRFPINEVCEYFDVDVDLYCGDKDLVYRYVQTVEKAGLGLSEISLDGYALGKEASLFEKSFERYQIAIKCERQSTTLSLFAKGKLISSECLAIGTQSWVSELARKYALPNDIADKLLHNNIRLNVETYPDTPIYLWSVEGKANTLSEVDAMRAIEAPLNRWLEKVKTTIQPILESSPVSLVLFGESGEINGLDALIAKTFDLECRLYIPETLGVRTSALASVSGLFYVLKDLHGVRDFLAGVDMLSFSQSFNLKEASSHEDTFSGRFKGLLQKR
jgi:cell division protein FtsA